MRTALGWFCCITLLTACDEVAGTAGTDCTAPAAYVIGTRVSGKIASVDCPEGSHPNKYLLTLAAQTSFSMTVTPAGFPVEVRVTKAGATSEAGLVYLDERSGTHNDVVFLPAGMYEIAFDSDTHGRSYTLESATTSPAGCPANGITNYTYPGTSIDGAITTNDCFGFQNRFYTDGYTIRMISGQLYPINVVAAKGINVEVHNHLSGVLLYNQASPNLGRVSFNYRATYTGYHYIALIGIPDLVTTAYNISIGGNTN